VELGGSAEAVVGTGGGLAVLVQSWGGEPPEPAPGGVGGRIEVSVGETADLLLAVGEQEQPLATWTRDELDVAARETADRWRRWSDALTYEGPWRDAVVRSSLALKLLVHEPTGAIAAAATTSLPEVIGGVRNWDYRFSWIRDASLAVDGMLALGGLDEARGYFDWLEDACHDAAPGLAVLFALDGSSETDEQELPLAGYRRSRPVRTGNAAAEQLQLGVYGEILQTAWLYHDRGLELTERMRSLLAETADLVCELWPRPDRGIWEARGDDFHFTHSKMMCAIALDRAVELAGLGQLAGGNVDRWRTEAARAREFVETRCWSDELGSYCRSADSPGEVDASLLLATILGYSDPADERLAATLAAVRERLGRGPYVYRYRTDDGLPGNEGAFVACSFWVAGALGRMERLDEAAETFESALALGNDLGLFSEEIDPETGAFLGNFPQAFSHLALVNAAVTIARRTS
jgi:GH15 family glucan-1,4-alpha-glucosidase